MRTALLSLVFAGFVSVSQLQLSAQVPASGAAATPVTQVEVSGIKFNAPRSNGDIWLEFEIELDVKPGGKSVTGEYVNRVKTTLSVMIEATDGKGQKSNSFYRASAEAVSLEGGKSFIRFYLPPEVVKRDRLRTDVKFYAVELEAGGEPQTAVKASWSGDFKSMESVKNFQSKVSAESGANEAVLMPQHLTPFAYDQQRRSPTVLRRELQR